MVEEKSGKPYGRPPSLMGVNLGERQRGGGKRNTREGWGERGRGKIRLCCTRETWVKMDFHLVLANVWGGPSL